MSRNKKPGSKAPPSPARFLLVWATIAVAVVAGLFLLASPRPSRPEQTTSAPSPPDRTPSSAVAAAVGGEEDEGKREWKRLVGRWLREDGGYVLEINAVGEDGRLEARYLNPRPINVARAAVVQEGASVKVGVELRDVGYPGSTYTLVWDSELDQLAGTYFQAGMGRTFDVVFVRMR